MVEDTNQGVTITLREIYDTLNGLDSSVKRLEQRIIRLEEKTSLALEAERRSREAIEKAEQALKMIKNREAEKKEYKKIWLSAILSSTIPWALTIIAGVIYLVQKGGI